MSCGDASSSRHRYRERYLALFREVAAGPADLERHQLVYSARRKDRAFRLIFRGARFSSLVRVSVAAGDGALRVPGTSSFPLAPLFIVPLLAVGAVRFPGIDHLRAAFPLAVVKGTGKLKPSAPRTTCLRPDLSEWGVNTGRK